MRKLCLSLLVLSTSMLPAYAQNQPLRIAVTQFTSPFVMQGTNQLYGFDIAMMSYICPKIHRDCQYQLMDFDKILSAVATNKVDIAVSAITITADRTKIVGFSVPYLISNSQFLGKINLAKTPFTLGLLEKSNIGVKTGTIFSNETNSLGVINPNITEFADEGTMIEALTKGSVDIILVDQPTAMFWQGHSGGQLAVLGKPITYGLGFGIAVSPADAKLLSAINQAITQYKNSNDYKTNVLMYIKYF